MAEDGRIGNGEGVRMRVLGVGPCDLANRFRKNVVVPG